MSLAEKENALNEKVFHLWIPDWVNSNAVEFTDLNVDCKVTFVCNGAPHKGLHNQGLWKGAVCLYISNIAPK
jgi:hypothetical protein